MPEICGICRDNNCDFLTRCNHFFHENCLSEWFKWKNECPLCRGQITLSKKMEVIMGGFIDNKNDFTGFDSDFLAPVLFQLCAHKSIHFNCIFDRLIDLGWDFNSKNEHGSTILHEVCKSGHLKLLNRILKLNLKIDFIDNDGYSPIHYACKEGHLEVMNLILSHYQNFDINVVNSINGMGCLHLAVNYGHLEVVKRIFSDPAANVNLIDSNGLIPLNSACEKGDVKFVNVLLENGSVVNTNRFSPIHTATFCGHLHIVELLLDSAGADPNLKDELGQTALHLACNLGHFRIARKLIDSGAHVNIEGPVGRYPIHNACISNYEKILQLLIMNGSKMDVLDDSGQTPLHLACKGGNTSLIEVLLQHGANPNISDKSGKIPLHYAHENMHEQIVSNLIEFASKDISQKLC